MPKANYNPIKITYPDGASVSTTYDPVFANPLTCIDEAGVLSTYEYDARGNLIKMTEAKGTADERIATFTYDQYGQQLSVTQQGRAAHSASSPTTPAASLFLLVAGGAEAVAGGNKGFSCQ